jgi:hypothetical protein
LSPPPVHYIVAYGVVLPFVLLGAIKIFRSKVSSAYLPLGWVILLPVLAYAPINLQRRLPEGIWVALVVLAMMAMDRRESPPKIFAFIPFALTFPTAMLLIVSGINVATNPSIPIFRPTEEVNAMLFLDGIAKPGEVILSSFETGNVLPAWTPARVVIGHGPETVGLSELQPRADAFFNEETTDELRKSLLEEFGVTYVFWGPSERKLGNWNLSNTPFLQEIYQKDKYTLFLVVP